MDSRRPGAEFRFTVFTPAYNRGRLLGQLYHSLQRQTFRSFEWLIVDDGSSDDTEERVCDFQKENNDFPIRCIRTANGGKHRAINCGVKEARGELFLIVDSDDYLTDNALEEADRVEKTIPGELRKEFAGICGLKVYQNRETIGTKPPQKILDITALEREKYGVTGDKAEVIYTSVMQSYPFPAYEGERFITENVVWYAIAGDGYKLRFCDSPMIVCEYLPDGLTAHARKLFADNPMGYSHYLRQCKKYGMLKGREKWARYLDFYYTQRDRMTFSEMGRCLGCNKALLWSGISAMRLWQRLTD